MSDRTRTCAALAFTSAFCMLSSAAFAAGASDRVPVEVAPVKNASGDRGLDLTADRLTDTLRRALDGSGRFTVVRSDLRDEVLAAQRRYLSEIYDASTAPEIGELVAARVLVKASLHREERGQLTVRVAFVDVRTLTSLPGLDLSVRGARDREDRLLTELAVAVAERAARASGGRQGSLDVRAKKQIELLAGSSDHPLARDTHTEGRRHARGLTYAGLLDAVEKFRAAVRLDPAFAIAHADLASAQARLAWLGFYVGETPEARTERLAEAREAARAARRLAPESAVVQREAARVYVYTGQRDLARAALERAQALAPNDPEALVIEAAFVSAQRARVDLLERAIAADPHLVEARFELALAYAALGDQARVRRAYVETLLEADPRHPVTLLNLAGILRAEGKIPAARRLLEVAIDREPRHALAYASLAWIEDIEGRSPRRNLERALRMAPEATLHFSVPDHARRAVHEHDIDVARRVAERFPKSNLSAVVYAARLAMSPEDEDQSQAVLIFSRLHERGRVDADDVYTRYYWARALRRTGAHGQATKLLEDLVERARPGRLRDHLSLEYARALGDKGEHSLARTVLTRLVSRSRSDQTRAAAQIELGRAYRQEGEHDLARRVFDRARGAAELSAWIDAEYASTLVAEREKVVAKLRRATDEAARRELEGEQGALAERARGYFLRALEASPGYAWILSRYSRFAWDVGDRATSLEALDRAVELDVGYLPQLAVRLHQAGRAKDAEARLNQATADDPGNHALAYYRGEFFARTEQLERAAQAYADAYHLRPSWAYLDAAVDAYEKVDGHDRAIRLLREALDDDPARAYRHHNRIAILEADRGRLDAAQASLLDAKRAGAGKSYVVQHNLAIVYARQDDYEAAIEAYEGALELNSVHPPIYLGYARLLETRDEYGRARRVLERGLEAMPKDRALRLAYARSVAHRKTNCHRAIRELEAWLVEDPGYGGYEREIGRCRLRNGQVEAAVEAYERATARSPRDAEAFVGLGEAYEAQKRPGYAWGAYSVAMYLAPEREDLSARLGPLKRTGASFEIPEHAPTDYVLVLAAVVKRMTESRSAAAVTQTTATAGEISPGILVSGTLLMLTGVALAAVGVAVADDFGEFLLYGASGAITGGVGGLIFYHGLPEAEVGRGLVDRGPPPARGVNVSFGFEF